MLYRIRDLALVCLVVCLLGEAKSQKDAKISRSMIDNNSNSNKIDRSDWMMAQDQVNASTAAPKRSKRPNSKPIDRTTTPKTKSISTTTKVAESQPEVSRRSPWWVIILIVLCYVQMFAGCIFRIVERFKGEADDEISTDKAIAAADAARVVSIQIPAKSDGHAESGAGGGGGGADQPHKKSSPDNHHDTADVPEHHQKQHDKHEQHSGDDDHPSADDHKPLSHDDNKPHVEHGKPHSTAASAAKSSATKTATTASSAVTAKTASATPTGGGSKHASSASSVSKVVKKICTVPPKADAKSNASSPPTPKSVAKLVDAKH